MTPIGHLSISYILGKSSRKICLTAFIIGGIVPDIEFFFVFFEFFNRIHRVVMHNLFFIVAVSIVLTPLAVKGRKRAVAVSLFLGGLLHLLVDSCMDNNPSNGIGIAVLWPLSRDFFSPFNLFGLVEIESGWSNPAEMIKHGITMLLWEAPLYLLTAFIFLRQKKVLFPRGSSLK